MPETTLTEPTETGKTMTNREKGRYGEMLALEYLKAKGYELIEQGFRSRFGEIDLIVRNSRYLVFAEVKFRKNNSFAEAREHVSYRKQKKLRATGNYWLLCNATKLQPRFDVIEVYKSETDTAAKINHIENAF